MRALPRVLAQRPDVDAVLVGGDEVSYGVPPPEGGNWRERMLREVGDRLPAHRVFFPGKLPYPDFVRLLKASSIHVYFTYPFVASWSLREALACGCVVIGSDTATVREFITHDENGWLSPFHDPDELADRLLQLLSKPNERVRLSDGARRYAEQRLDLSLHFAAFDGLIADALARGPAAV
jgi:glycosyltransferase involved in cell wall biosynthesis